jgi:hypothetical protein
LGISLKLLETIANKFHYPLERLQATLETWLGGGSGQDPTWRSLVAALNCIEEKELADKVEKKHCGPLEEAAPSKVRIKPTLPDLYPIPIANSNWRTLGLALGLSQEQLSAIELKQNTDHKRKRAMFRRWLEVDSRPSWKKVIRALEAVNESEVAEKVRLEYNILLTTDSQSNASSSTRSSEETDGALVSHPISCSLLAARLRVTDAD